MSDSVKILIYIADPFLSNYLQKFFSLHACQVIDGKTLPETLAYAHSGQFDLVIMDVKNFQVDMFNFIESLKSAGGKHRVLVLNCDMKAKTELKKRGADLSLVAPVNAESIAKGIRDLVTLKPKESLAPEQAKVVIVDDEEELCDFLADHLESRGFETYRAYNGQGAIELVEKHQCNLAITDLKLPQIRGEELAKKWGSESHSPIREIIVITGGLDECVGDLKRSGLNVFQKPIDLDVLTNYLIDTCQRHNLTLKTEADK